MADEELENQWYWDNRNRKAYYPVERDDGTVTLATVWHEEELADALDTGTLEPLGAGCLEHFTDVFEFADTFRTPEHVERWARELAGDTAGGEDA